MIEISRKPIKCFAVFLIGLSITVFAFSVLAPYLAKSWRLSLMYRELGLKAGLFVVAVTAVAALFGLVLCWYRRDGENVWLFLIAGSITVAGSPVSLFLWIYL